MTKAERLNLIREISRLERELLLKKGKLAQAQSRKKEQAAFKRMSIRDWEKEFADLIEQISRHSRGGNSVEDVRKERDG